ncbi:hypothetical protein BDP81DRAFT_6379 [Colletotrichum phormii]|uniref:Uncharacterized protein n=1 Tax=Colletotrichum phormii TaxID=359342 RepID=A0AAJ0ENH6_9PEZI|nr:uncharacterized protein BDP81DRAFT_6379 [Colletotrichum phormii]KAK1655579.1 hypothetical protein BDP81DRAFT_6379 [Colletotrichum phormii]
MINLPVSLAILYMWVALFPRSLVGFTTLEALQRPRFPRQCGISLFYARILEQSSYAESLSSPFSSPHLSVNAW